MNHTVKLRNHQSLSFNHDRILTLVIHETKSINLGGKVLRVKVLTSEQDKARGYQFKKEIPDFNQGLLFVFNKPGIHSFHMRNVYFDLDLLSFDAQGRFLGSQTMKATQGPTADKTRHHRGYETPSRCMYVIECQPGWGSSLKTGVTRLRF